MGARTHRSLGYHLLHPLILRLLVLCAPADSEAQSSLLYNGLHPQIQIPNACPGWVVVIHEPIKVWKTSCNRNDNKGREESQIAQFWETVVYEWPLSSKSFVFPSNMDDLKRIFQLLMCLRKISALELSTSFKVTNVNKVDNSKHPFNLCNV